MLDVVASNITKNFVMHDKKQPEMFVNAIKESHQEFLYRIPELDIRIPELDMKIIHLKCLEQIKQFIERRKKTDVR